ncbi:hypothetical protein I4U23_011152 [Adineta vaga]|nr:hypothetical protein I4U23_011152 [Adineta vaga]
MKIIRSCLEHLAISSTIWVVSAVQMKLRFLPLDWATQQQARFELERQAFDSTTTRIEVEMVILSGDGQTVRTPYRKQSMCRNVQCDSSIISQTYLPHSSEYHPQPYVPPTGLESQQSFIAMAERNLHEIFDQSPRRLSIISQISQTIVEEGTNIFDEYNEEKLKELNIKYHFWTFISINFPQLYRNIRHFLAFLSCVFTWRGFWMLYDAYISIFKDDYKTYLLLYLISFLVLCILQASSSINGPLSNIVDKNNFFPLYPHCYVSTVYGKLSRYFSFRNLSEENTKL